MKCRDCRLNLYSKICYFITNLADRSSTLRFIELRPRIQRIERNAWIVIGRQFFPQPQRFEAKQKGRQIIRRRDRMKGNKSEKIVCVRRYANTAQHRICRELFGTEHSGQEHRI